jgi:serine phosphatase RsbU (regulator of sigma subunit)
LEVTALHAGTLGEIRQFIGSAPQFDDITLVVIKKIG